MKKVLLFIILLNCCFHFVWSQEKVQYFITANGNYYLPYNSGKQTYPILAHDKEQDPKVLVGGFGVGFTAMQIWKEKFLWKLQANISRHAYWDEPLELRDANNNPLGIYTPKSIDYALGVTPLVHYRIGNHFSLGAGLGVDVMLLSVSKISYIYIESTTVTNRYYKTIMPVLPIEMSLYLNRVLINIRYQHGLVNRFKKPLSEVDNEHYGILAIEIGCRIN